MTREGGFTLIETLVAMTITAMLAIAGTTLLVQTTRASEQVKQRTDISRRLDLAHTLMRDDFSNATLRASADVASMGEAEGFSGRSISGRGTLVSFVRSGWTRTDDTDPRGELQRVEYLLEDGALIRRAWLRPDPVKETPYVDRVLEDQLVSADVRYGAGDSWQLTWSSRAPTLPETVEITLRFSANDQLKLLYLVGGGG